MCLRVWKCVSAFGYYVNGQSVWKHSSSYSIIGSHAANLMKSKYPLNPFNIVHTRKRARTHAVTHVNKVYMIVVFLCRVCILLHSPITFKEQKVQLEFKGETHARTHTEIDRTKKIMTILSSQYQFHNSSVATTLHRWTCSSILLLSFQH